MARLPLDVVMLLGTYCVDLRNLIERYDRWAAEYAQRGESAAAADWTRMANNERARLARAQAALAAHHAAGAENVVQFRPRNLQALFPEAPLGGSAA